MAAAGEEGTPRERHECVVCGITTTSAAHLEVSANPQGVFDIQCIGTCNGTVEQKSHNELANLLKLTLTAASVVAGSGAPARPQAQAARGGVVRDQGLAEP